MNSIFEEFKVMWPGLKIIHGRPRHSQSQGSVERLNQTAERMLQKWCADTGKGWVAACIHVQWGYNTGHHSGVGKAPYVAVFGSEPRLGLSGYHLPPEVVEGVAYEETLEIPLQVKD